LATASNFAITIHNSTADEVKATKFEYKNGSNWETEHMFGIDGYQKIEEGRGVVFHRNLGGVGGESTQFRVTYEHHVGGTVWGSPKVETTDSFVCNDNGSKTVTLTA
jgi:hypothetical protein